MNNFYDILRQRPYLIIIAGVLIIAFAVIILLLLLPSAVPQDDLVDITASSTISTSTTSTSTLVASTSKSNISTPVVIPSTVSTPTKIPVVSPPASSIQVKKSGEIMAWIYPGDPGCAARGEYRDGRKIDVLKPEYYRVGEGGVLEFLTEDNFGCNGYSAENIADISKYSKRQFVTVASSYAVDMGIFLQQALDDRKAIHTLTDFVVDAHFEGVELDFEDFGGWTDNYYDLYKRFAKELGTELHKKGKELMLVGPATANAEQEAWFKWRYGDFVSLPVDMIIIMTYDYQFDHGAGNPVAPFEWIEDSIEWALSKFPDKKRLGAGIPSYGYRGITGTQSLRVLNRGEITDAVGNISGTRDVSSGELVYTTGDTKYYYQDSTSMDQKYSRIAAYGLAGVSVWSLGGNPWFVR